MINIFYKNERNIFYLKKSNIFIKVIFLKHIFRIKASDYLNYSKCTTNLIVPKYLLQVTETFI